MDDEPSQPLGHGHEPVHRQFTPAHFVRDVRLWQGDRLLLRADLDFAISENPTLRFRFSPRGTANLRAEVTDTQDKRFAGKHRAEGPARVSAPGRSKRSPRSAWREGLASDRAGPLPSAHPEARGAEGWQVTTAACTVPLVRHLLLGLVLAAAWGSVLAAPFAYITNQGSNDVSVVDLAGAPRVVATVPVGAAPAGVVASSRRGEVFVANAGGSTVSVIDMRSLAVVASLPSGGGAVGIDASADGQRLFVVDLVRPAPAGLRHPHPRAAGQRGPGHGARRRAAEADGRQAWVAERDDDRVALVDVASARVLARVTVGNHPFALLLDTPRQRLYALNVQDNSLSVIDTRQRSVIATLATGKAPYGAPWPTTAACSMSPTSTTTRSASSTL